MLKWIISRLLRGRHYWRGVSFDEIAELYTSRLLTVFAINIVNMFAAVYLYKLGYSLSFIVLFYGVFYLLRIPFAVLAAKCVAFFGPKHGILFANLLRIPSLVAFAAVSFVGDNALLMIGLFGLFQQLSAALYDIAYTVDFSKVKHFERAGHEIGVMQQVEKIARVISPLVGGALASLWSPEAMILVASGLFMVSALPLFHTVEPTALRNRVKLRGFPWRLAIRSLVSQSVVGMDYVTSGMTWTLFVVIVVFAGFGNNIYAALGGLASLGVFASIIAAWIFGRLVDRHHGDVLLVSGVAVNVVLHLCRPFVHTPTDVITVGVVNETATSAYSLPFTRVLLDVADTSGYRVAYLMFAEIMVGIGAALACFGAFVTLRLFGDQNGLAAMFVVMAGYQTLMLLSSRAAR